MAHTAKQAAHDAPASERAASAQLTRLYANHGRDVLAYALRRAASAEDAAEVVADTFLIAWRRLSEVPAEPEARLWLYGVARRTLANQRRGESRRTRLAERLRVEARAFSEPRRDEQSEAILAALAALTPEDRELLLLIGWEELSPAEAARVLDISAVAARARLHRARRRLRQAIAGGSRIVAMRRPEAQMEEAG